MPHNPHVSLSVSFPVLASAQFYDYKANVQVEVGTCSTVLYSPIDYSLDFHMPHSQLCTLSSFHDLLRRYAFKASFASFTAKRGPLLQKEASTVSMNGASSV